MLVKIGSVLERSLKQLGVSNRVKEKQAVQVWFDEVGPEIARAARPVDSREGILFVAVRTSAWAQQLAFLKEDLLVKLNRRLGRRVIRDIKFRVGPWPESPFGEEYLETSCGRTWPGCAGSGEMLLPGTSLAGGVRSEQLRSEEASELVKRLGEMFEYIPDDKLKGAFIKAVVACKMACERGK
ncbi:MAG: DUF721 domain-containing protein [Firmicutes bacterium]|nr:DUF721 domain-containing protein [Bacillota bacterium]